MSTKIKTVLLTGEPGVGKTTLVRNVCEELLKINKIQFYGFYTEERRNVLGQRSGFDVVSLIDGKRGLLAKSDCAMGFPMVGKYAVFVNYFDEIAIPILKNGDEDSICVLDELGKMELISKNFENIVEKLIQRKQPILATIPLKTRQPIPLLERLKKSETTKIFRVTRANRNTLQSEIVATIQDMMMITN